MDRMRRNIAGGLIAIMGFVILMGVPACKESPTVFPFDTVISAISNPPGYYFPEATAIIPSGGGIAVNTSAVITFNLPINLPNPCNSITVSSSSLGLLTEGVHYSLPVPGVYTNVTINFIGAYSPIPDGDTVTINVVPNITAVMGGITDSANSITVQTALSGNFTVGTAWDSTAPAIVGGTNNPVSPPMTVFLTTIGRGAAQEIHVQFNENIDPASVTTSTFYLTQGATVIPSTVAYVVLTRYAIITPSVNLDPSTTYTVHVRRDIRDLAGNTIGPGTADAFTWPFDTTASLTELDPTPGIAPTVPLSYLYVDSVTDTSGTISWVTNEPTYYTLNYERNATANAFNIGPSITASTLSTETAPGLTDNARYWFTIDLADIEGLSNNSGLYQFNTQSNEADFYLDGAAPIAGNQNNPKTIPYHPISGAATGCYIFWNNSDVPTTYTHIYGQLFDNGFGMQWTAPRQGIFTEAARTYTYQSAAEDGIGGIIVTAIRTSDGRPYAKRLNTGGAFYWGDTDSNVGLDIAAPTVAISNVSAVPVAGVIQLITNGTTEMGSLGLNNPFFDDDVDLSGLTDLAPIMDRINHDGTTIDNTTVVQDFRYILGQDNNIITSGDTYYIGSFANQITYTALDHEIRNSDESVNTDYVTGPTDLYTGHGDTLPGGWTIDLNDLVRRGATTSFDRVSGAPATISLTPFIDDGTAEAGTITSLLQILGHPAVNVDDHAVNRDGSNLFSRVTVVTPDWLLPWTTWLDLSAPTAFDPGDIYDIYQVYCFDHSGNFTQFDDFQEINISTDISITTGTQFTIYDYTGPTGTANAIPANPLLDNEGSFNGTVNANDIVINYTDLTTPSDPNVTAVSSAAFLHALGLNANIMADGEDYNIIRFRYPYSSTANIIDTGLADNGVVSHLEDATNAFATVQVGDLVYNLTDNRYALVTARVANDLTLSRDAAFSLNDRYAIIRQRGILYTWEDNGNVWGRVMSANNGTVAPPEPDEQRPPWIIVAGTSPRTISDGSGNAILVYNSAAGIQAARLNGQGTIINSVDIDTAGGLAETIIDVQSDGAGGVVILYKYSDGALHAQRVAGTSTTWAIQWGAGGQTIHTLAVTTQDEVMAYDPAAPNDVYVAATVIAAGEYDIWVRRSSTGATGWGPFTHGNTGTRQEKPQIYLNGTSTIILWDDYRFYNQTYINTGYGLFGLMINSADGTTASAASDWRADDAAGAGDYEGVSIILNQFNEAPGVPLVVPYNNDVDSILIWTDYRAGLNADLKYIDLDVFVPSP